MAAPLPTPGQPTGSTRLAAFFFGSGIDGPKPSSTPTGYGSTGSGPSTPSAKAGFSACSSAAFCAAGSGASLKGTDGGFYSGQDADIEGREGAYYLLSPEDVAQVEQSYTGQYLKAYL